MKVGSLVELVDEINGIPYGGEIFPIKGVVYTIRDLTFYDNIPGCRLEEIINPIIRYNQAHAECTFLLKHFRELQPPMDVSELIEECQTASA